MSIEYVFFLFFFLQKMGWATFWHFFTHSSGHPVPEPLLMLNLGMQKLAFGVTR
jgi:hypothetical protein